MKKRFFWIALGITVLRIVYLLLNHRDLDIEEAQYWTWSQVLSFGYHSKPPMISWVIHFSTLLFGDSEAAIRFFSPVAYFFSALFLYGVARILFNKEAISFWTGITVLLLPGVTYSATLMSTDPLLILFWTMAMYCFLRFFWIGCGIAIGLGLLSKYTLLFFFLCAALYVLFSPQYRAAFKKPGPYLAIAISLIFFLPNIVWNLQHHNAALHHVVTHNIHLEDARLHFKSFAFFILTQFGIFGPILTAGFIMAVYQHFTLRDGSREISSSNAVTFLLCFSLPILFLILAEALFSRAYGNWAALTYAAGVILVVAYFFEKNLQSWLKWSNGLHIAAALLFFGWELCIAYGVCHWPISVKPDWKDFGTAVHTQQAIYPNNSYLVDNRELWAKTLYYGRIARDDVWVWDPHDTVDWVDNPVHDQLMQGQNFIFITDRAQLSLKMQKSFQRVRPLTHFRVTQRLHGRQESIYIYELQNFLGYQANS